MKDNYRKNCYKKILKAINYFNNKSNYSSYLIIPLINILLIKYYFGDFDNELVFSVSNIIYWFSIITISIIILYGLQTLF